MTWERIRALPPRRVRRAGAGARPDGRLANSYLVRARLARRRQSPKAGVLIERDGELISSVAAGVAATDGAIVLRGLTLPGLANAHSHASSARCGAGPAGCLGRVVLDLARADVRSSPNALDPDGIEALARATFAEMALAGITLVGEFTTPPRPDARLPTRTIAACSPQAAESGSA